MEDENILEFRAWLKDQGLTEVSVSKLLCEDFVSPDDLTQLAVSDTDELGLTLMQRKRLRKIIAEIKWKRQTEQSLHGEKSPRQESVGLKENISYNLVLLFFILLAFCCSWRLNSCFVNYFSF